MRLPAHARLPLSMLALFVLLCAVTGFAPPAGRLSWFLEMAPALAGVAVLAAFYPRFRMSDLVYITVLVHAVLLAYGGYYTYALTPLGNWAMAAFDLSRNHYDRVGHFALGFFPCLSVREVLLRATPLRRGGWLTFLVLAVVLAVGALWELIEWWTTLVVASDVGLAFLGSQGDVWDAQWDMFLALVGAAAGLVIFSRLHDRSMANLPTGQGGEPRR